MDSLSHTQDLTPPPSPAVYEARAARDRLVATNDSQ